MRKDGLFIGELAHRGGVSRKALRLYETAGILPVPRRTGAGYRVYGQDTLGLIGFIRQARRLGFTLQEIKEIVAIKRSDRVPCPHVRDLVNRKIAEIDKSLADLTELRTSLRTLLSSWRSRRRKAAAVCPHIEHASHTGQRR